MHSLKALVDMIATEAVESRSEKPQKPIYTPESEKVDYKPEVVIDSNGKPYWDK